MLIKNGIKYYEEKELREYAQGYWDGRFEGVLIHQHKPTAYLLGFAHGEADYHALDAYAEEAIAFDDMDVVDQIKHTLGNP